MIIIGIQNSDDGWFHLRTTFAATAAIWALPAFGWCSFGATFGWRSFGAAFGPTFAVFIRAWWFRMELIGGELAIVIGVESFEGGGGALQFIGGEGAIFIDIEGDHDRRHHTGAGTAAGAAGAATFFRGGRLLGEEQRRTGEERGVGEGKAIAFHTNDS